MKQLRAIPLNCHWILSSFEDTCLRINNTSMMRIAVSPDTNCSLASLRPIRTVDHSLGRSFASSNIHFLLLDKTLTLYEHPFGHDTVQYKHPSISTATASCLPQKK